jgi:HEPN domain-containing protein
MNEFENQPGSWIRSAKYDLDTAALLINEAKLTEGLFFCLLAIEKGLKAHSLRFTEQSPPDTDDPNELLQVAHIRLGEKDRELMDLLMEFRAGLKYPAHDHGVPGVNQAFDYLERSRELLKWLEKTL